MATGRPPGRPAKSVNQKIAEGNKVKKRLTPEPPSNPNKTIPPPPSGLGVEGKRVWEKIFSIAGDYVNPEMDILQIETFCYLYEETENMRRQLALGSAGGGVDRVVSMNKGQTLARHPFVQDIKDNRVMMTSILASFGFTPADRARLNFEKEVNNAALQAIKDIRKARGTFGDS